MRRSTRAFWEEGRRTSGYGLRDWLHGYVYGRWPYFYIRAGTRPDRLPRSLRGLVSLAARVLVPSGKAEARGRRLADTYHGKVLPTGAAEQLVTLNVEVDLRNLEQIIPYKTATDIVLRGPDRIVALECPCRAAQESPCLPLDVCLVVGEPFASFIADHQPKRTRWISQEAAVEILRAEHARGHVHHAFFKDAMLGRFYAICNCCSCCCGAMRAHRHGVPMLASSGYIVCIDDARCRGCGACTTACPFAAIYLHGEDAAADTDACMGCGVCLDVCPTGALSLVRAPERGSPLEIRALIGT